MENEYPVCDICKLPVLDSMDDHPTRCLGENHNIEFSFEELIPKDI